MSKNKSKTNAVRTILLITLLVFCFVLGYYVAIYRVYKTSNLIALDSVYEYCKYSKCSENELNSTVDEYNSEISRQTVFRGQFSFIDTNISMNIPDDWYVKYSKIDDIENYLLINDENALDYANMYIYDIQNWIKKDDIQISTDQKNEFIQILDGIYDSKELSIENIDNFNNLDSLLFDDDIQLRTDFHYINNSSEQFRGISFVNRGYLESIYYPEYYIILYSKPADKLFLLTYKSSDTDSEIQKFNSQLENAYFNDEDYQKIISDIDNLLSKPRQEYEYGRKLNQIDNIAISIKSN